MNVHRTRRLSAVLALALVAAACTIVPITGRRSLSLVSATEIQSMSFSQYSEFMKEHPVSRNAGQTAMVQRIGSRVQHAVEAYFKSQGWSEQLAGFQWEFNLVEDEQLNAWCMPGGKVVVYTGILPVARDETGLAVVMGHEIAHAVAGHSNERLSQELVAQLGASALGVALDQKSEATKQIFLGLYGAGKEVGVMLPYSRRHETEADRLGLIFMALAGYDPRAAVGLWQRMAAQSEGAPPEFLSTHPSDETRIRHIQSLVPEAMEYYRQVRK